MPVIGAPDPVAGLLGAGRGLSVDVEHRPARSDTKRGSGGGSGPYGGRIYYRGRCVCGWTATGYRNTWDEAAADVAGHLAGSQPRRQCSYVIESERVRSGPGAGKVWWRRWFKRTVPVGETRCWQHR